MNILPAKAALAPGVTQPFSGANGVAPYVFSLAPNSVGSIDSVSGLFSALGVLGEATVIVTDANNNKAEADVMVGTPLELFCDVIQEELGLAQGRVFLWDQQIKAPIDKGLFVAVGVASCRPFSNINSLDANGNQVQSTNFAATVDVSIISVDAEARDRKEEVILALNSQYAEQQQELNGFRIFPLSSSFVNLSAQEGAAIPYRFTISVILQYAVTKIKAASYYNTFPTPNVFIDPTGEVVVPVPPVWTINNFTLSSVGRTSVTASWDTLPVPTRGRLRYGTDPLNLDQEIDIPLSAINTSHSINVTGLLGNTDYYFMVEARDIFELEHDSAVLTAHTLPIWALSNFTVGSPTTTTMLVAWDTTGFATSGVVNYGTDPNNLNQQAIDPSVTQSHSLSVTGLQSNTTYYFQAVASDTFGQSASSTVGSGLTNAAQITSGLVLFLDGTDVSTMTLSGSRVDEWRDKLGSGNKVATGFAGTAFNPAYDATLFGGLGGVNFNAKFLETPAAFTVMNWSGYTLLLAIQRVDVGTYYAASDSTAVLAGFGLGQRLGGGSAWNSRQGLPLNTSLVTGAVYDGAVMGAVLDGSVTLPQNGVPTVGAGAFGKLQIGGIEPGGIADMRVIGVFAYDRVLSPAEIVEMNRWIKVNYAFADLPAPAYNVVADGDSISVGYFSSAGPWMISDGIGDAGLSQLDYVNMASSGISTPALTSRAPTVIDPLYDTSFPAKRRIIIVNEITNDLANPSQTALGAYDNMKAYCQARKAVGWKVIVGTCLPRSNAGINVNFEADRISVNTMIRTNAIAEGWADAISDIGGDALIGAPGASDNTTYYDADKIHLNATGHGIAKTYVTAALGVVLA